MKRGVELIMFDLDGTLADTGQDLAKAVNHVRSGFKLEPLEHRLICGHVGRGVEYLMRHTLPDEHLGRLGEALNQFLQYYERHLLESTELYPHVLDTLDYFSKKKKVIVTNKPQGLTVSLLKGLGIVTCFDAVLGGDSGPRKKPDPEPLRRVLACFDVEPVKAVMVGDGNTDIEAGKGAGVHTCGVTYGLGRIEELREAKPDFLIDDLRQLTEHFC